MPEDTATFAETPPGADGAERVVTPAGFKWRRFAGTLVAAAAGLAVACYLFVLILDPYGLRAGPGRPQGAIMDLNQRFMYPQIIRSGRYDAAVFGTSTVRLLDPEALGSRFGAHFANLGLNAGTPWEQMQLAALFLRHVPTPKHVVLGLDLTWCEADADRKRTTFRAFPPWLYDDSSWNDLPELLSLTSLEIAGRLALHRLGLMPERIRRDGYEVFVPPEEEYNLARARSHIWNGEPPQPNRSVSPPVQVSANERAKMRFPALPWLDTMLGSLPNATAVTLVFPPIHIAAQPVPGSATAAHSAECERRIASLADQHGALLIDFRKSSPVTRDDANYWDPLHYRIGIAARMVDALASARSGGGGEPGGFYQIVTKPRPN